MTKARKNKPRERYTLRPHEKREIGAMVEGKTVNRQQLRGLATKYGVALKVIHEVVEHHNGHIDAAHTPKKAPDRPKLGLKTKPTPKAETLPESEDLTDEKLLKRKFELDRKEADIRRREDSLLERERLLEQDRYDVETILAHEDDKPAPEEIEIRDRKIAELERRIAVLSDESHPHSDPKMPLYSAGIVKQALLVKDAEIARLKRRLEEGVNDGVPEALRVM